MQLAGNNLKRLYLAVTTPYENMIGEKFKWGTGEKNRIKQSFIQMAERLKIRDDDGFDYVLDLYSKYIAKQMQGWLSWDQRSRANLVGTLIRKDDISVYAAKFTAKATTVDRTATDLHVPGTQSSDEWEF